MPTHTPIDAYAGYINFVIAPELKAVEQRILANENVPQDTNQLIDDIGVATAVKTMVYTDALEEEEQAAPEDVEKELCLECHNTVWDLGERYGLDVHQQRRAWVRALRTISEIVRASYPTDKVADMSPLDIHNFDFHAGPEEDDPVESAGET